MSREYNPRAREGLADRFEYVMYGRVYKLEEEEKDKLAVYVSYGGLLMCLRGDARNLQVRPFMLLLLWLYFYPFHSSYEERKLGVTFFESLNLFFLQGIDQDTRLYLLMRRVYGGDLY